MATPSKLGRVKNDKAEKDNWEKAATLQESLGISAKDLGKLESAMESLFNGVISSDACSGLYFGADGVADRADATLRFVTYLARSIKFSTLSASYDSCEEAAKAMSAEDIEAAKVELKGLVKEMRACADVLKQKLIPDMVKVPAASRLAEAKARADELHIAVYGDDAMDREGKRLIEQLDALSVRDGYDGSPGSGVRERVRVLGRRW